MRRVVIASVLLIGCTDPVEYEVTTSISSAESSARLVYDGRLYVMHTETYQVSNYDELRDVAQTATIRSNGVDTIIVLPFAASECGSEQWMHSGELVRIEVAYSFYPRGATFIANTEALTCIDSNGETHAR